MISLKAICEDNFVEAFNLKLAKGQEEYVSHPVRSLAQAYVYRNQCQPFGIYDDDRMVGYVMVIYDYDIPEYDIWHMMIDASEQKKGYGRAALRQVIEYIREKPFGNSSRIALTCNKNNPIARKLYESFGFSATGVEDEDEVELAMDIDAGVVHELVDPLLERNMVMQHCFVGLERVDDVAKDAFDRMIRFIKSKVENN